MKCFLKYKTKKILEFDLEARTGTHVVKATSVIDRTLLPEPLKRIKEQHMPAELMKWLARRAIPNNRYDIDKMLLKLYGLRYCDFGRLYSHQHIAALLSHYASWFDNYIVDVEHPKALFFGYEDFRFSTLWFLEPYNDESISRSQPQGATDKYVENIKKDAPATSRPMLLQFNQSYRPGGVKKTIELCYIRDYHWKNILITHTL